MAKNNVAERQMGRILALVEHEALTVQEISHRLYISESSVSRFVAKMRNEKPRRIYVSGYLDTGTCPTKLLRKGKQKDAEYTLVRKRKVVHNNVAKANAKRDEILELLAIPQTSAQLARRMKLTKNNVNRMINEHRNATRVYIASWLQRRDGVGGSDAPIYARGNLPDRPRVPKKARVRRPVAANVFSALFTMEGSAA